MTLYFLVLIAGLAVLMWSADKFVDSAGSLSYKLGLSPLLIGMTVVALGTSAPEAVVAINASLKGSSDMVIGNALGSNIANIALVLGITALIAPLPVCFRIVKKELPLMIAATGLAGYALANSILGIFDAIAMLTMLLFSLWWLFKSDEGDPPDVPEVPRLSLPSSISWLIVATLLLGVSSQALVWSASNIAIMVGVSELVIGLTIIAIGTSLPELAASAISALKRQHEIAIGNIIGSNMFNLLLVLAIPGIISPGAVPLIAESRDFPTLLALTLAFALILVWKRHGSIPRWIGGLLFLSYLAYIILLFITPGA